MIALACINIAGSSWLYVIEMVPSWWLHYSGLWTQVDVKEATGSLFHAVFFFFAIGCCF